MDLQGASDWWCKVVTSSSPCQVKIFVVESLSCLDFYALIYHLVHLPSHFWGNVCLTWLQHTLFLRNSWTWRLLHDCVHCRLFSWQQTSTPCRRVDSLEQLVHSTLAELVTIANEAGVPTGGKAWMWKFHWKYVSNGKTPWAFYYFFIALWTFSERWVRSKHIYNIYVCLLSCVATVVNSGDRSLSGNRFAKARAVLETKTCLVWGRWMQPLHELTRKEIPWSLDVVSFSYRYQWAMMFDIFWIILI